MLAVRDFAPRNLSPPSWSKGLGEWEPLSAALAAANEWMRAERIDMVNVETVVMPFHSGVIAFDLANAPASFINGSHWYVYRQVIRVWYRAGDSEPVAAETRS